MSEKQQRTAASMREKMISRYGDELHHKHDKNHTSYRMHCRTHPVQLINGQDEEADVNTSTGSLRLVRLRKIRKRLAKGRFH